MVKRGFSSALHLEKKKSDDVGVGGLAAEGGAKAGDEVFGWSGTTGWSGKDGGDEGEEAEREAGEEPHLVV